MIWDGGLLALLAKNNFDEEYSETKAFTVSTCAWFRETVMRRGLFTMCDQSPSALFLDDPVAATGVLSLAEHWHGRRALSNHVCAHSGISMWHVICLQHLARACSEQSKSTSVLPINMWSRCCNAYRDLWIMRIVSLLQSTYSCNVFPSIVFAPVHRRPTDRECHCYKLQGNRSTSPRITSRRLVDPGKLYRPAPGGDNCSL